MRRRAAVNRDQSEKTYRWAAERLSCTAAWRLLCRFVCHPSQLGLCLLLSDEETGHCLFRFLREYASSSLRRPSQVSATAPDLSEQSGFAEFGPTGGVGQCDFMLAREGSVGFYSILQSAVRAFSMRFRNWRKFDWLISVKIEAKLDLSQPGKRFTSSGVSRKAQHLPDHESIKKWEK